MLRSINLHHHHHHLDHHIEPTTSHTSIMTNIVRLNTIHNWSLFHSIIILFIIFNLFPDPTPKNKQNKHAKQTHETQLRLGLSCSHSPLPAPRSCSCVWECAYRVWTRLCRHRLPAQRGVRHHQRLVQLQSARWQGLRQLSDLQAQERLWEQPGQSLLVVG